MARDADKWAHEARSVFDCSELTFRSLAELEAFANGLVFATQGEITCLGAMAADAPLSGLYAAQQTIHTRYQIAKYLRTSIESDFANVDGLRRATAKLQFISRILQTKLQILEGKITKLSLARFTGNSKPLRATATASFLDEVSGELSQFERQGAFWAVSTYDKTGLCRKTRVSHILNPATFR